MQDDKLIEHLKEAVSQFGSQTEVAKAASRANSTVCEWLKGVYKPDVVALMNLDEAARKKRLKIRFNPRELRPELF